MSSFFKSLGSGILRIFGATASEVEASTKEIVKKNLKAYSSDKIIESINMALRIFVYSKQKFSDKEALVVGLKTIIMMIENKKSGK